MRKRQFKRFLAMALNVAMIFGCSAVTAKAAAAGSAIEFYISQAGNDLNDGSIGSPVKTFDRALALVKANNNKGSDVNVYVRGGEYLLPHSIDFTPDIWSGANTLTFSPYGTEQVTISGANAISAANWQPYAAKPGVYVANIGTGYSFDALYVNGAQQILCRYPNYAPDENLKSNITISDAQLAAKVATWANPAGGFIRALHVNEWGGNDYIITGKNGTTLNYNWVGDNNRGSGMNTTYRMVENIFEELDSAGEWFYNQAEGNLYFWPPAGVDLSTATLQGATLEQLVTFKGEKSLQAGKTAADEFAYSYNPVKNITFEGFTFENTHRTLFTSTYERPLRGDWGIARKGAIYMENSENISILNSTFTQLGGNGVMMSAYNKGNVVDYCDFTHIGASCVLIVGLEDAARNPSHWDPQPNGDHKTTMGDLGTGPRSDNYPRNITVSDCYMYDVGTVEKQVSGVCMSISSEIKVLRNTMHRFTRAAINISDGTFGGHEIAYNDVFDCVRETGDHGPINAWGRDRFWSLGGFDTNGNNGALKRPYALYDAVETTLIHNNRIHEINGSFGIDLDDGATNYKVYNNLVLGASIKCREGFLREVYNNIIVGKYIDKHCSYANNDDKYYDDIVFYNKGFNIAGGESAQQTTTYVRMYYYNGAGDVAEARGNVNTAKRDPMFVNPLKNDYTVAAGSPVFSVTNFVNFPMQDSDFGQPDKPKAPIFTYTPVTVATSAQSKFIDYGADFASSTYISNIIDDSMRSAAGLPDYNGVALVNVAPGGYFAGQGFMNNDVIREINGYQITDVNALYDAFRNNYLDKDLTAVIYRNQSPMTLNFVKANPIIYPWMPGTVQTGTWQWAGGRTNDDTYCGAANSQASNVANSSFEFTFSGTGVEFMSEKYSDEGTYDVYIDGVFDQTISGVAATRTRLISIYSNTGLSNGQHVLKVVNKENKWLILDGFKVYNTFDSLNPFTVSASNGSINVVFPKGIPAGIALADFAASCSINAGASQPLALTGMSQDAVSKIVTLTFNPIARGGFDQSAVVGVSFQGSGVNNAPAFVVTGAAVYAKYNDNPPSASLVYSSTGWQYSSNRNAGDYNNDVHATGTNGAYVDFSFTGVGVDLFLSRDTGAVAIDIYIDGVRVAQNLSANAPSYTPNNLFYSVKNLDFGSHTLRVTHVSGGWLNIDAFGVYNLPAGVTIAANADQTALADAKGGTLTGTVKVSNNTASSVSLNVYAALYSPDKVLTAVKAVTNVPAAAYATTPVTVALDIPAGLPDGCVYKLFVWDAGNYAPLAVPLIIN